ncbi:MAG: mucoidy inhibitor MuiA family protein [Deltaproteobacteria bacterium]|nr:mucoidy inhibitor MuiA family protein [Deltaproteobacteria bacterium]
MTTTTTTTTDPAAAAAPALVLFHPAVDETRVKVSLPITKVTLLEDRAQVMRTGTVNVVVGKNRLALWDVAPVLQDVSLRVEVKLPSGTTAASARLEDARVRRAMRVGHREKPEAAAVLERKLEELSRRHDELIDDAERSRQRASIVGEMMQKAVAELPEDAAWSLGDPNAWKQTFEALSQKSRGLLQEAQGTRSEIEEVRAQAHFTGNARALIDSPEQSMLTMIEIDLLGSTDGPVDVVVEYTVPNALWRPTHEAALQDGVLTLSSRAAVWQNTGEEWKNVELVFSTARSSLGHEPPKLSDDRLSVQKKDNRVIVEAREVSVSNAGLGRGGGGGAAAPMQPRPAGVDLPGVDDGGDIQNLKSLHKVTVPSDGRPAFVPVSSFSSVAETSLVVMAEVDDKAFLKAVGVHKGKDPVLAGPVELVRESGFVGTTRTLFVAPGERYQLGFGPDDDVRVQRTIETKEVVDEVDKWRRRTHTVALYLSNLGADEKQVEIVERLPVSEIEHVKVTLVADKTSGAPKLDDDGFLKWTMALPARGRLRLGLVYVTAFAPGVTGL